MSVVIRRKQHERFFLERFFEDAALTAEIVEEREVPDFIVRFEKRTIGVEITSLFIANTTPRNLKQEQESISTSIVSKAQKIYETSGARPVHLTVCFAPRRDLRKMNRDSTAEALSTFVRSLNLLDGQRAEWRPEELDGPLPDEISYINALGVPRFEMAHWSVARAGWATPLTTDALQVRVDKKSQRLSAYQKAIDENWLIIVTEGTKPSGLFYLNSQFDASNISSTFSRTFFYNYSNREVIELGL